jgi:aryl-alcohol dehydrogenase-like predicted oxidoreductase
VSDPDPSASPVAFSLGPSAPPSAGITRERLVATLRGAFERGIRTVDLSDSPATEASLALVRESASERWRDVTVFLSERPRSSYSAGAPRSEIVLERNAPGAVREPDQVRHWGVRFTELGAAEAGAVSAARSGARWVALPGSVLDANRLIPLTSDVRRGGADVLLTDPHADGRLDGRWLTDGLAPNVRSPRPVDLEAVTRSYAPVLALRFLTEGHRRTLPQAAVAFALALGATPSVRFRDLGQVAAYGVSGSVVPLSEEELARLGTA